MKTEDYIKPKSVNLESLFGEGYSELIIPEYQRTYDWKKNLVEDFLQDLWDAFNKKRPAYFIGAVILSEEERSDKKFDVVDGQQRIVTISLLIAHIAAKMEELKEDSSLAKEERAKLGDWKVRLYDHIIKKENGETRVKFHHPDHQRVYEGLLQHEIPSKKGDHAIKNLKDNYKRIKDYLEKRFFNKKSAPSEISSRLQEFRKFLFEQVLLTILSSEENKLDAYEIFEVLNDRRQELTQIDLLKNYFFRTGKDSNYSNNIEHNWKGLTERFAKNGKSQRNMQECIEAYFMYQFGVFPTRRLYREVKDKIEGRDSIRRKAPNPIGAANQIKRYTEELKDKAVEIYWDIKENREKSNYIRAKRKKNLDTRQYIGFLRNFSVLYPSLLAPPLKDHWDKEDVAKYYKLLYYFILRIYSTQYTFPANRLQPFFANLAQKIRTEKDGNRDFKNFQAVKKYMINELKNNYNQSFKKGSFITNFSSLKKNTNKDARIILLEINYLYSTKEKRIDPNEVDLEHILPKKWKNKQKKWEYFTAEKDEKYLTWLGNLTLWSKDDNRESQDSSYDEKKDKYKKSTIEITREISKDYEEWSPEAIEKRQEAWAKKAEKSWRLEKV